MADARKRDDEGLGQDPLVGSLAPGGAQPPPTVVLTGFLGESPLADSQRLYLDANLTHYVDIPTDAILHSERVETEGSPLRSTTTIWVRAGTPLQQTVVDTRQVQAEFLQGGIVGGAARPGPGVGPLLGQFPPPTFTEFGPRCTLAGPRCELTEFGPRCPDTELDPRCAPPTAPDPRCPPPTAPDPRCPPPTAPDPRCPPLTVPDPRCPATAPDPRCPPATVPDPRCPRPTVFGPRCTVIGPRCNFTEFGPRCNFTEIGPRCVFTEFGPRCNFTEFGPRCDVTDVGPLCSFTEIGPRCF